MALIERDRELAAIAAVLARGGTLVIEGGAGIGKTALLDAACARAADRVVLGAHCSELESGFAFGMVRQLFERRLAAASGPERDELLAGPAAIAGRLLLSETSAAGAVDASFALLHGLYWLTANLADRQPLLLIVDDVHFADVPSLRWLAHVAARVEGLDLAMLVAVRSFEPVADVASMAQVRADATVVRPRLLSVPAIRRIVQDTLGDDGSDELAASVARASGGNPFYVAEMLRAAAPGQPLAEGGAGIQHHVLTRLRRLDVDAQSLARSLAVLGDGWPLRCGARVAGMNVTSAARAADDLLRYEVLASADPPSFLHPIIRAAVDASLRSHERAATHRAAARVLCDEGAPPGRVAAHLMRCPPAEDPWVTDRLRVAARSALEAGAPQTAAELLRRALAEPPPADEHVALLRDLARAEVNAGLDSACARLDDALALTSDVRVRGEITLDLAETYAALFRWADAVDIIETAVPGLVDVDRALVGRLEAAMVVAGLHDARCAARVGPVLARLQLRPADGALDEARIIAMGMARVLGGRPAHEAAEVLERALANVGPLVENWDTTAALLWALVTVERFDAVEAALTSLRPEVERSGSARGLIAVFSTIGLLKLRLGALPEAQAAARVAFRVLREGDFAPGLAFGATVLADVSTEAGELEEAAALLDLLPSEPPAAGVGSVLIPAARGRLRLAQGRPEAAFQEFERCASMFTADVWGMEVHDVGYVHARSGAALAALLLGHRQQAVMLAEAELADIRTFAAPRALGIALRITGLAVGGEPGLELLAESVDCLHRSPAALERARSLLELGAALRRRGHRVEARGHLAEALDLAARCAAQPLAARARDELVAAGARPRRDQRFGVAALTPSEVRVAELAAAGKTNREIAQHLYVTLKTVEGHLAQAYTKLGITGRGQLSEALDGKVQGDHPVAAG